MRQIVISSTTKPDAVVIESSATTRQELVDQIQSEFENLSEMILMIGETSNTLALPDSLLPEEEFTLFIMPKVKTTAGGNVKRSDVYNQIRAIIKKDPSTKETFGNYTTVRTSVLLEMIKMYNIRSKSIETANTGTIVETVSVNEAAYTTSHPFYIQGVRALQSIIAAWKRTINPFNYDIVAKREEVRKKLEKE